MRRTATVGPALAWLLTGCGAVSTTIDWSESYAFSDLSTYAWVESDAPPGIDASTVSEIMGTADAVLQGNGHTKDADRPTFLVASYFGPQEGYATRRYSNPYTRRTYQEAYKRSILIIDVVDPEAGEAVWSGNAVIEVDPNDVHKNAPLIREAVRKLLADFPPEEHAVPQSPEQQGAG
jgi:uncharacterized protein YceK